MIESIINQLRIAGITEITISIGHGQQIVNHIGSGAMFGVKISYIDEKAPTGTAGSLKRIMSGKDVFVINSDIMTQLNFDLLPILPGKSLLSQRWFRPAFRYNLALLMSSTVGLPRYLKSQLDEKMFWRGCIISAETIKNIKK